jgi:hypothetical protein
MLRRSRGELADPLQIDDRDDDTNVGAVVRYYGSYNR